MGASADIRHRPTSCLHGQHRGVGAVFARDCSRLREVATSSWLNVQRPVGSYISLQFHTPVSLKTKNQI